MKSIQILVGVTWVFFFVWGCANDSCKSGSCYADSETQTGVSVLWTVDAATGKMRWGAYIQGDQLTVDGVRDDGRQVVVQSTDACWDVETGQELAFDVETGREVALDDAPVDEAVSCTASIIETPIWSHMIDGVCVETDADSVVAVDSFSKEVLWTREVESDVWVVDPNVLLVIQSAHTENGDQYRLQRVDPLTGEPMWNDLHHDALQVLGSTTNSVMVLSRTVFALSLATGDLLWETQGDGWSFDAHYDRGMVDGESVFVAHQQYIPSPCNP